MIYKQISWFPYIKSPNKRSTKIETENANEYDFEVQKPCTIRIYGVAL